MTDGQLDALEAAARNATPGPWHIKRGYCLYDDRDMHVVSAWENYSGGLGLNIDSDEAMANAKFLEATNPAAILELVQEVRQLQIERDWLAEKCESIAHALDPCEFYPAYYWKDQARQYIEEIACQKN